jgi:acetylornithine deacetylase/succinyl-diaminopimelate desuccinylase-like protein
MSSLDEVHRLIEASYPAHLESIREFLRMPSVSADGTGIRETGEAVKAFIKELGGQAEIVPTAGQPAVYGELSLGKPKTLLVFSSYDVVPAEEEEWIVPPFSAEIVELPDLGRCLVSRGVYDTKAPLRGFFNAVRAIQEVDELPVNLKFIIEGGEEQGSKGLPEFFAEYRDKLACDAALLPFFSLDRRGTPVTRLGTKGIVSLELVCQGGEWGGPQSRGIHSRHGTWISSPVWRLVQALSSMIAEDETAAIEGFYDEVTGPDQDDQELLDRLEQVFDEMKVLEENDVARFMYQDLHGAELLTKHLYLPVINLDGLVAGHTGAGVKNVIGHKATAKVDIRLVPDMTVEATMERVRDHLARHGFDEVQVNVLAGYSWSRTPVKTEVVEALLDTYRYHGYEPEVWPTSAGSGIFYLFTRELGVPLVPGGLCHGGNAHSANEYAVVDQIELFEKSMATFLYHFGGVTPEG